MVGQWRIGRHNEGMRSCCPSLPTGELHSHTDIYISARDDPIIYSAVNSQILNESRAVYEVAYELAYAVAYVLDQRCLYVSIMHSKHWSNFMYDPAHTQGATVADNAV